MVLNTLYFQYEARWHKHQVSMSFLDWDMGQVEIVFNNWHCTLQGRNLPQVSGTYTYVLLIACHSVYNSLQSFKWLVILQCSRQSYGSSVCQFIASEAAVQTLTHLSQTHIKQTLCFCVVANYPDLNALYWGCHRNKIWGWLDQFSKS